MSIGRPDAGRGRHQHHLSRTSPIWETLLRTDLQDSVCAPRFLVVEDDDIRSVKLGRAAAEEYFDVDLLELAHQPERWVQFVDEFGYDREKRREFFRRFGRQGKA